MNKNPLFERGWDKNKPSLVNNVFYQEIRKANYAKCCSSQQIFLFHPQPTIYLLLYLSYQCIQDRVVPSKIYNLYVFYVDTPHRLMFSFQK